MVRAFRAIIFYECIDVLIVSMSRLFGSLGSNRIEHFAPHIYQLAREDKVRQHRIRTEKAMIRQDGRRHSHLYHHRPPKRKRRIHFNPRRARFESYHAKQ